MFYGYSHNFQALQLSAHLGAFELALSSALLAPRYLQDSLFRSLLKATSSERASLTPCPPSLSIPLPHFIYPQNAHSLSLDTYPCVDLSAVFHL